MLEEVQNTQLESDEVGIVVDSLIVALRRRRRALKWTQRQIAEAVGVSPPTVSGWESGRSIPPLPQLRRWAQLFDLDIELVHRRPSEEAA